MVDFSIKLYQNLLIKFQKYYKFQTLKDFFQNPLPRVILLRHDIDLKKKQAEVFAQLENSIQVKATYYFRAIKPIFDPAIIRRVKDLGHEIGYHYEDLSLARGDHKVAIKYFENHLEAFRKIYPVETICMHGNSLSRYDNRKLWDHYNYREYGIIGEPYFDLDFNKVLYLTDTAQRWDGSNISVRDHVKTGFKYSFRTTFDIINQIEKLPDKIMITVHPDRWTDNLFEWYRIQSVVALKNLIKKNILKRRKS